MQHSDAKPEVNKDKSIGYGECPILCQTRDGTIQWECDSDIFVEKIAEYAYVVINNKKDKVGFITFVMNVAPLCDCVH